MGIKLFKIILLTLLVDNYFLYGNSMPNSSDKKFEKRQITITKLSGRRTIQNGRLTSYECCMMCVNITECDAYQFTDESAEKKICKLWEGVEGFKSGGSDYIYIVTTLLDMMSLGSSVPDKEAVLEEINEANGTNITTIDTTVDGLNSTVLTTTDQSTTDLSTTSFTTTDQSTTNLSTAAETTTEEVTTIESTTNLSTTTPLETTTEQVSIPFSPNVSEASSATTSETTSTSEVSTETTSEEHFRNVSTISTTSSSTSVETTATSILQKNGFENYYKNRWSKPIYTGTQQCNWHQANIQCQLEQEGAHLYIIRDADDAEWLANKLYWLYKDYGQKNFWIGLLMNPLFRYPIWVDGSDASTTCRRFAEYLTKCTLPTKYLSQAYAIQESESTFKIHSQRLLDPLNAFICQYISWASNG